MIPAAMRVSAGRRGLWLGLALALGWAAASAGTAQARATFVINNLDSPGVGFNDATPVAPVGGNSGTTLGQQRMNTLREATNMWGRLLDSLVPIVIDASFGPLACNQSRVVLGQARATGLESSRPGLPPGVYVPEPLADRLAEVDLNPGFADIEAMFNPDVLACTGGQQDWYYGLDGKPAAADIELLSVILHELGHGLGFLSAVDDQTGQLAGGLPDVFTTHILDNATGQAWTQMTDAQRAASTRNFRHLVWTGANVLAMAPQVLAKGAPRIMFAPTVSGLGAALSEANFGPRLAGGTTLGRIVVGTPIDGCAFPPNYAGAVVLFAGGVCPSVQKASLAEQGGALAVLIADPDAIAPPSSVDVPPDQNAMFTVHIPVAGVTVDDADRMGAAAGAGLNVTLGGDGARLVGADDQGRMLLYASDPVLEGSTISHWDPLARPNLMQEPNASFEISHDLRMEAALLRDIGWTPFCGNNRLDPDEQCDKGASNSDTAPGACRTNCKSAACGDGVVDPGEACDSGASNSNTAPGACRTGCMKAACGDGVVDPGEACDSAASNSDTTPGACRSTCVKAACGDGVLDPGEACDTAASNSDTMPGACRKNCKNAACGDGVVDPGESCDDGAKNGASAACHPDCSKGSTKSGCGCALGAGGAPDLAVTALGLLVVAWVGRRRRRL